MRDLDAFFGVDAVRDDDWTEIFDVVYETPTWKEYVEPRWMERWNGLMLKGGDDVTCVATCVFPSDALFARLAPGTFLFTEHPIDDATGDVFAPWSRASFERARAEGISVYTAHAPLDHHPEVSPSLLIAGALGLSSTEPFFPTTADLPGGAGVIGDSDLDVAALAARLKATLGDDIPVRIVGAPIAARADGGVGRGPVARAAAARAAGRVAVVAGGGADVAPLEQALARGCTTYVTGNAASPCRIPFVRALHDAFRARAAAAGIAVVDGTHYGTEKPAQLAMAEWFRARGLDAVFEPGRPERE